jgi:membrane-associated phospholipid phosphatase
LQNKIVIRTIILLFFVIIFSRKGFSENDSTRVKINKQYFRSYLLDTRDIITAPTHWKSKQWVFASSVITTSVFLIFTSDRDIQKLFQESRTIGTDNISRYGSINWGSGLYSMGTMAVFYGYGILSKKERPKKTALIGLKTYLLTGAINYIPKFLFHRERPFVNNDPLAWCGPFKCFENHSFPSGHTMSAFAIATIIASEYKEYKVVPVICYSIATLTGLSRINDNKHWASDVLMGAALGYGMAKVIYNKNNWKVNITPYTNSAGTTGLLIQVPIKYQ